MDRLLLEGMAFFGHHGVHPAERELGARFVVDAELELDLSAAGRSDRLEDSLDYRQPYSAVREVVEGDSCHLIEALAERIANRLLAFEPVSRVTVRVRKRPPLRGEFASFGVELTRQSQSDPEGAGRGRDW
ncbi:MAG TPA: dihydroneopterin aldolase [Candidatus Dormibacteraeota bacterium]|nr:dihydroneopterin aldolase [Candidatus Dormibacteraeota bacterium]